MLRWSMSLVFAMGLVAIGLSGIVWFTSLTTDKVEDVRRVRAQHQQLEQQLKLLQSPGIGPLIDSLKEDLDALQIKLVEALTQQPAPAGVLQVGYEQTIMPQALEGAGESINVLRLELQLIVQYSTGLLDMLTRIDALVDAWPHETRACELQRLPQQKLKAQCVVDFYHWRDRSERESVQSQQLRFRSVAET